MSASFRVCATLVMLPASLVRVRALKSRICLTMYSYCWPATRGISFYPAKLEAGAKVNSRDRNSDTPLNMAAPKDNAPLADALLKAGADVNLGNLTGVTPLIGAAFSANAEILQKLLAQGAKTEPVDRVKKKL